MLMPLALLSVAGCADDEWVEFRILTETPAETVLQPDLVQVPEGWAIGVEAIPIESHTRLEQIQVLFVPDTAGVIGIDRGLEMNHFVIYGVGPGSSTVDIYFDDEIIGDIPARVTARQ